jgi:hypothetical protein
MPPFVRRKAVGGDADLGGHYRFELIVCNLEESKKFSNEHSNIAFVDKSETEIEGSPPNTDIRISKTV